MKSGIPWKLSGATLALMTMLVGVGVLSDQRAGAQSLTKPATSNLERSLLGLKIAKDYGITLNLKGKDPLEVGLGSYFVNGPGGCNGCHYAQDIGAEWSSNPYNYCPPNSQTECPKQVNLDTYLGGGRSFGPICLTQSSPLEPGSSTPVTTGPCEGYYQYINYSKNLTPDDSGMAAGGLTFAEFLDALKTGHDPDQAHANTLPPVDGTVLQVMPWPDFQTMTVDDIHAMYQYLSAVPCIANTQGNNYNQLLVQTCP